MDWFFPSYLVYNGSINVANRLVENSMRVMTLVASSFVTIL